MAAESGAIAAHDIADKSYADIFYIGLKVRAIEAELDRSVRQIALQEENRHPTTKNVLYLHFPFCAKRCEYCIYFANRYEADLVQDYLQALETEITQIRSTPYIDTTRFECVYFGGGTPSLMTAEQVGRLAAAVRESFHFVDGVEITFEANPSTLSTEKIRALKEAGVNRISLGIQSLNEDVLRQHNCNHTARKALETIERLSDEGFTINLDVLFGLPGQTRDELEWELDQICNISRPLQLTLFPVRILSRTPLHDRVGGALDFHAHLSKLLDYDSVAESLLHARGYTREEIPIFFFGPGSRKHIYNSAEARIVGLGAGAGSVLDRGLGQNVSDAREYVEALASGRSPYAGTFLTETQAWESFVFNRVLFMNRSLPRFREIVAERFDEFYGCPVDGIYEKVLEDMKRKRLIKTTGERIHLTSRLYKLLDNFRLGAPSII